MAKPKYRRVIIKLSGEALSGPEKFGIHQPTIERFAADLVSAHRLGIALGVVVGGGNVLRGAKVSEDGLSRPTADAMGMLATVMNALVLEAAIERAGVSARAMSALTLPQCAKPTGGSGRSGTWKITGSSCLPVAPGILISPPTRRPFCGLQRCNATPFLRPRMSMGYILQIQNRIPRPSALTASTIRKPWIAA